MQNRFSLNQSAVRAPKQVHGHVKSSLEQWSGLIDAQDNTPLTKTWVLPDGDMLQPLRTTEGGFNS